MTFAALVDRAAEPGHGVVVCQTTVAVTTVEGAAPCGVITEVDPITGDTATSTILSANSASCLMEMVCVVEAWISCAFVGKHCRNSCLSMLSSNALSTNSCCIHLRSCVGL